MFLIAECADVKAFDERNLAINGLTLDVGFEQAIFLFAGCVIACALMHDTVRDVVRAGVRADERAGVRDVVRAGVCV